MGQFSKRWEDLNFSDNFIFCKVMHNEDLCKKMVKILLDLDVERIEYLNTEQHFENYYDSKGIRMDLFIKDSKRVIDLEMQTGDYDDLLLRSRYYQASADVSTVPRRTKFKDLKELYVVFICRDDPFGAGLSRYSKKMMFKENPALTYDDKTHTVFYNCSAYEKAENEDVRSVLEFIYNLQTSSDFTKELKNECTGAMLKSGLKDEYMYFQDILEEEKEIAREEGHAEGVAAGIAEGLVAGIAEGREKGRAEGRAEGREKGRAEGLAEGRAEGHAEGRAEGQKENTIELAKRMFEKNIPVQTILDVTKLTEEELKQITETVK